MISPRANTSSSTALKPVTATAPAPPMTPPPAAPLPPYTSDSREHAATRAHGASGTHDADHANETEAEYGRVRHRSALDRRVRAAAHVADDDASGCRAESFEVEGGHRGDAVDDALLV